VNAPDRVDGLLRRLSLRLLPGCCVQCGAASERGIDLCPSCEADLPWNRACCARCALPLSQPEARCGRCLKAAPEFDAAFCAFRYEWPLDSLVTRFKFAADLAAGAVLARLLHAYLVERVAATDGSPRLMMPIPLHEDRLRERGFNQALELARPLARLSGIALAVEGMHRLRATPRQTGLNALHRRRNVRGAFVVDVDVRDRHVVLVDDVITTAATVRECAKTLKRAGAASVQVWAVARAAVGARAGAAVGAA
jgi:ComF family protein